MVDVGRLLVPADGTERVGEALEAYLVEDMVAGGHGLFPACGERLHADAAVIDALGRGGEGVGVGGHDRHVWCSVVVFGDQVWWLCSVVVFGGCVWWACVMEE